MTASHHADDALSGVRALDLLIVGAGFGGIYAVHRARQMGLSVRAYEKAEGVGGTWYYNRYPGARCDVDSVDYSYSFSDELQQEWDWTEKYSGQAEILAYTEHVVERFDLGRDIQLDTKITRLDYDDDRSRWDVETNRGERISARWVLVAAGLLSVPKPPPFAGVESFRGEWHQTSRWPKHPVDFKGKRVAVIGTGSSGIQAIPVIAEDAAHLTVFQRTPNFSIPARNRPISDDERRQMKATYGERRRYAWRSGGGLPLAPSFDSTLDLDEDELERELQARWELGGLEFLYPFRDFRTNLESNQRIADFVRRNRDEVRVARRLYRKQLVDGVYPLDAGALLDQFFHFLRELGIADVLEDVRGKGITREMVPMGHYVLLYGLKTLLGMERMNALPEWLFSDEASMCLVGFNAHQVRHGVCQRGAAKRQGPRTAGPIGPEALAHHLVKLDLRALEVLFNGVIRALAKAGLFRRQGDGDCGWHRSGDDGAV